MKYLVTGGAGFIGSHIARDLVGKGEEVIVLDNLFTGTLQNIADINDKIRFVNGDIRDLELLKKEFKNVDFVLHQASLRSVPQSMERPYDYHDVNINGHLNVLEAARLNDVKCVTFAGSSSASGNTEKLPIKEDFYPNPISPYALTKLVGERYNKMYADVYGLNAVSLRYFNVDRKSVV